MGHACEVSSVLMACAWRVHGVCMGARLFGVVQVDVAEQAGAIARRPTLVLWHRLRSEKANEQKAKGDVEVGRGAQRDELSVERGPVVRLFRAPCHQHGHARRRVNRTHERCRGQTRALCWRRIQQKLSGRRPRQG